jgi:hypothetical protein
LRAMRYPKFVMMPIAYYKAKNRGFRIRPFFRTVRNVELIDTPEQPGNP